MSWHRQEDTKLPSVRGVSEYERVRRMNSQTRDCPRVIWKEDISNRSRAEGALSLDQNTVHHLLSPGSRGEFSDPIIMLALHSALFRSMSVQISGSKGLFLQPIVRRFHIFTGHSARSQRDLGPINSTTEHLRTANAQSLAARIQAIRFTVGEPQ